MEHKHEGLFQDVLPFQTGENLRFQPFVFLKCLSRDGLQKPPVVPKKTSMRQGCVNMLPILSIVFLDTHRYTYLLKNGLFLFMFFPQELGFQV